MSQAVQNSAAAAGLLDKILRFDPALTSGSTNVIVIKTAVPSQLNKDDLVGIELQTHLGVAITGSEGLQLRRLTAYSGSQANNGYWQAGDARRITFLPSSLLIPEQLHNCRHPSRTLHCSLSSHSLITLALEALSVPLLVQTFGVVRMRATAVGATSGVIPEIDIKVDSSVLQQ